MGISNCCVFGKYEGLYFIDYDDIHVFRHKDCDLDGSAEARFLRDLDYGELTGGDWIFDDLATQIVQQEVLDSFTSDFLRMFPNFSKTCPDLWISRSQKAILESPLFYLCLEDNNWSLAVELIQKEPPQGRSYAALQARCYQRYLTGIARCLLNHLFDEDGSQLCCTEPGDSFDGPWELQHAGIRYTVTIKTEHT